MKKLFKIAGKLENDVPIEMILKIVSKCLLNFRIFYEKFEKKMSGNWHR
jgi:hypothetical protein